MDVTWDFRLLNQCGWGIHSRCLETTQWIIKDGRSAQEEVSSFGTFRTLNMGRNFGNSLCSDAASYRRIMGVSNGYYSWSGQERIKRSAELVRPFGMNEKRWECSKVCCIGKLRGRRGSEGDEWGKEEEGKAVLSGEQRINFAVAGEKSRLGRDTLEEKTTARMLGCRLKLAVKPESASPVEEVKTRN